MGKSIRKKTCMKLGGPRQSSKHWRSLANRSLRNKVKVALKKAVNDDEELEEETLIPKLRDVSDPWDWPADGLAYYFSKTDMENSNAPYKFIRK